MRRLKAPRTFSKATAANNSGRAHKSSSVTMPWAPFAVTGDCTLDIKGGVQVQSLTLTPPKIFGTLKRGGGGQGLHLGAPPCWIWSRKHEGPLLTHIATYRLPGSGPCPPS